MAAVLGSELSSMFAGIAWDPHIRGALAVMVGVAVLCGSIYLLLGTNLGARLGLLVALAGLAGWLVIITLIWWINPKYIGNFFVDERLIITGLGGLVWMSIGAFIMAKMVSFEI